MKIEDFEKASELVGRVRRLETQKEYRLKNIEDFLYCLSEDAAEKIKTILFIDLGAQISAAKSELEGL